MLYGLHLDSNSQLKVVFNPTTIRSRPFSITYCHQVISLSFHDITDINHFSLIYDIFILSEYTLCAISAYHH